MIDLPLSIVPVHRLQALRVWRRRPRNRGTSYLLLIVSFATSNMKSQVGCSAYGIVVIATH